jgi:diacylglycerol kinase family enzyme
VAGILQSGIDVPIGYIPAGSTNDFASSLHLSQDILQAAQDIVEGTPVQLDIGNFGGRYFSYVASFGAFTRTSYTTPQSLKNALGHTAYVLNGIQELSQIRSHPLRFTLSDGSMIEGRFLFGAISNSTSLGGVLTLTPDQVDMADGKLELLLIRNPETPIELGQIIVALNSRNYDACPCIRFVSTRTVKIRARDGLMWSLDGEGVTAPREVTVTNVPDAIRVVVPPKKEEPRTILDAHEIVDLIDRF